jgi:hypothetical protein
MSDQYNREQLGPFDLEELGLLDNYVDFGAILIPADNPDVTLRIEVEESTGRLVAVTLDYLNSTLQVTAFSAPKSDGIWSDVRDQLAQSIIAQGGEARLVTSGFEDALLAKLPNSDGPFNVFRDVKFVGVDGPRWFLRGLIEGAALEDVAIESAIDGLFRSIVVNRGDTAMPPKEMLELTMPPGNIAPPRGF